jgi:Ca-dependent carbohydrate-binding module xylan-binding
MKKLLLLGVLLLAVGVRAQDVITTNCAEDFYTPAGQPTTDAKFSLVLDGATISGGTFCSARNPSFGVITPTPQVNTFTGAWGTSITHTIRITFLNDAFGSGSGNDRNLYIVSLTYNGVTIPAPTLTGSASPISPQGAKFYRTGDAATWTTPIVGTRPIITAQPANQNVAVGQVATFSVGQTYATSFQWQLNSINISGATQQTYSTPATTKGDNGGQYQVILTNGNGSTFSNPAILTVNPYTGSADGGLTTITTWNPTEAPLGTCGTTLTCTTTFTATSGNTGVMAVTGLTTQVSAVLLSWVAPITPAGGVLPTQFNIYRGTVHGGPYVKIGATPDAVTLKYSDNTVKHGTQYYFVVTAAAPSSSCIDNAGNPTPCESVYSNESGILFP